MKIIAYNIRRIVVLINSGIIFIIEDFYRASNGKALNMVTIIDLLRDGVPAVTA